MASPSAAPPTVTASTLSTFIEKARTDARHGRLNLPKGRKTVLRFRDAAENYLHRLDEEGGKDLAKQRERLTLHLTPHFKDDPLSGISAFAVDRYKKQRIGAGAKPGTVSGACGPVAPTQ
jgi:hypothetical protein